MADDPTPTTDPTPTPALPVSSNDPAPTPAQPSGQSGPSWADFAKLQADIATMPERMVNSLKEAFPAPPKPKPEPTPTPTPTPTPDVQPAKRKTFAEWWSEG